MPDTTGNFQDLVQLSGDTLYHLGEALVVGNSLASTVTFGLSNSNGSLAIVGSQTGNQTLGLPTGNGTLLSNINVSAGTTSNNLSALTFSNSNGVSFGLNGSTVTASINPDALAIGAIQAGTQTATSGTVVFSNSNNVTFGMSNSSVITASAQINVSAGTTSNNLSAVTFSNSNNVSFGMNGSTVTASATVASTQGSINFSAGTTSNNLASVTFSNSNGVSFGLNGSTITASVAGAAQGSINFSAGTTSNNLSAVTFSNSNGISFGLNGSTITAQNGGLSSFSNGFPATALSGGQNTLFFDPFVFPACFTATAIQFLASITNVATNSSGGFSASAGIYTITGSTLSLASSASTNLTWTSGAALSSNTGINYHAITFASWNFTPGFYVFGWWISTQNSASLSYYGPPTQPAISSGQVAAMSTLALPGYSQATTNAMPGSFGISNTASYIRTGATAAQQPFILFQGT
jgi:hypothetical protein